MMPRFLTIEDRRNFLHGEECAELTPEVWTTLSPEIRAVMELPVGQRSDTEPPMVAMSDADLSEVSEGLVKAWDNSEQAKTKDFVW
ncbi:MAG: hypothetical protein Unbinned1606contig1000_25 [Prokaryotic dsDNA virus sp.]|nr:MAG: hypothetical protein Unbinned1606contig1000_25 [Prokaryotic dsDNA virus sp.]|tara:strand:- start:4451 stop:4708 length:258 start_codon:yes stop_codon:yes gene_type:complete